MPSSPPVCLTFWALLSGSWAFVLRGPLEESPFSVATLLSSLSHGALILGSPGGGRLGGFSPGDIDPTAADAVWADNSDQVSDLLGVTQRRTD